MKQKKRFVKNNPISGITNRITIPVLVAFYALTIIFSALSLVYTDLVNREVQFRSARNELDLLQSNLNIYFTEMNKAAVNLRINEHIELFFKHPDLSEDQLGSIGKISSYTLGIIPSLYSIYIVNGRGDNLAYFGKNSYAILDKSSFFDQNVLRQIEGGIDTGIIYKRTVTEQAGEQSLDLITVYHHNGVIIDGVPLVTVAVNMRFTAIENELRHGYGGGEDVIIIDREGNVLSGSGVLQPGANVYDFGIAPEVLVSQSGFAELLLDRERYYVTSSDGFSHGIMLIGISNASRVDHSLLTGRMAVMILSAAVLILVTLLWLSLNRFARRPITQLIRRTRELERSIERGSDSQRMNNLRVLMQRGGLYSEEQRREMIKNSALKFSEEDRVFLVGVLINNYLSVIENSSNREYEALIFGAENMITEILSADMDCFTIRRVANGSFIIICRPAIGQECRFYDIVSGSFESIRRTLPEVLGLEACMIYSSASVPLYNLYQLAETLEKASLSRPFLAPGTLVEAEAILASDSSGEYMEVFEEINRYTSAMQLENYEASAGCLEEIFSSNDPGRLKLAWTAVTLVVFPMLCSSYSAEVCRGTLARLNECLSADLSSPGDIRNIVEELHLSLCSEIAAYKTDKSYDIVSRIDDIVLSRYNEPELNVSYIAEIVGVSSNYLGSVYRKQTGRRLTEFIQQTRLEAAKDYLENTDMLIAEIGRACGYEYNLVYFQQLFKKKYAMTPTQYRRLKKGG